MIIIEIPKMNVMSVDNDGYIFYVVWFYGSFIGAFCCVTVNGFDSGACLSS